MKTVNTAVAAVAVAALLIGVVAAQTMQITPLRRILRALGPPGPRPAGVHSVFRGQRGGPGAQAVQRLGRGVALGIMMIPIMARTTEELSLLVPGTMGEGALALGATRARAVFTVALPAALPGIITGVLLALARIAGETA